MSFIFGFHVELQTCKEIQYLNNQFSFQTSLMWANSINPLHCLRLDLRACIAILQADLDLY